MMKFKKLGMLLLVFAFAGGGAAYATSVQTDASAASQQTVKCTGVVVDNTGLPVIGASVVVRGTRNGVTTDLDGNFSLNGVKNGDQLEVSYMGYVTQILTWNGQALRVVLQEDSKMLDQVVVTALGLPKQAKSVGYATSRVSTTEVERASVLSPVNALQGKVAGVQINSQGASGLTSSSSITIRGAKSVDKNNSPIFVIDGMIIQEKITGNLDGTDWGSQLKNLNPADYESVTVLKGAAATALYGSRGANGAVVIVSKGGKYAKQGLGVEVNQVFEWTDIYKSPIALQNEFGAGSASHNLPTGFNDDGTIQATMNSWGPKMDGRLLDQLLPNREAVPFVAHPNNWKDFYKTGMNSTTNVALSGGGENSSFRLSYGYTDNTGVFIRNTFNRHNITFRGLTDLNRVFSIEVGAKYAFSKALNGASQGGWDWPNNVGMLTSYYMPRNFDVKAFYEQYRDPETHAVISSPIGNQGMNSYFHNRDMNVNERSEQSILADLTLRAKIAPWLNASIKGNYNFYTWTHLSKSYGTGENYGPSGSGSYSRSGQMEGYYNATALLQSNDNVIKIGNQEITLSAILGAELYGNTQKNNWSKGTNGGLVTPAVFAFANSKNKIEPSFNWTPANERTLGVFAIANLGWKDQLFLELTARNDWLSTLTYPSYVTAGKNNYTVFYPSANLSWVFTDTFADKMPQWFDFGKLRASLAQVGMGTSAYATTRGYGVFEQGAIYLPDRSGSVLRANPNLGTAFNADLKPEIQQSIEIGTDLRFLNEMVTLDVAYYKTNTFNQILSVGSVSESGASTQMINAGNIQNQGWEVQLDVTPIRTQKWRWTIGGNFTRNRGKVIELDENVKEWQLMGGYDAAPEIWAYEGGEFGVLTSCRNSSYVSPVLMQDGKMVITYLGRWNENATYAPVTLYDRNEEGDRERHILGKVEPDFTLSLNTSLSYKNFDLYVQGDGRFGGNFFSNLWKYASACGTLASTVEGRSKEHGGIERIDNWGNTVYDGQMLDAVFMDGTQVPVQNVDGSPGAKVDVSGMTYKDAVEQMGIMPSLTRTWYGYNYGWGMPALPGSIQDNTWFCLREITLGYRLPENICRKFGANYFRVGVTARNVCYLINKLTDGLNPASISSNNPLQPMDIGGVPFYRTYAVNLTVRF